MGEDIVVSISKKGITINGIECNQNNYEEVFQVVGVGEYESKQIINLLVASIYRRGGMFKCE